MARILLTIVTLLAQGSGLAGALTVEVFDASVALRSQGDIAQVRHFALESPARLVVDLYGTRWTDPRRHFPLSAGFERMRVGTHPDKTRIVFDVDGDRWPGFELVEDPGRTSVVVRWQAVAGARAAPPTRRAARPVPPAAAAGAPGNGEALPALQMPPAAAAAPAEVRPRSDHGPLVDLVVDEAEVRDILQHIAEVGGQRIVVDESVTGRLMLRLVDVPWEQALEMVLGVTGLRAVEDGAVLHIMGPATAGESAAPTLGGLVGRPSGRGN